MKHSVQVPHAVEATTLDPGEGSSIIVPPASPSSSRSPSWPASPFNNISLSSPGLPTGLPTTRTTHSIPFKTPATKNEFHQLYHSPVQSPPIPPQPRKRIPSISSDNDIEIVAEVKREMNVNRETYTCTCNYKVETKRRLSVCELVRARDEVEEKKRKILDEYFKLDKEAQGLEKKLKERLGH